MKGAIKKYFIFLFVLAALFLTGFTVPAENSLNRVKIVLNYNNYSIIYKDDLVKPTNHLVAEEIHNRKINASYEEKMNKVDICIYAGADYKTALLYCFPLLQKKVSTAIEKVNSEPVNSKISFSPGKQKMFSITKEKNGAKVDENILYQSIYFALRRERSINLTINPKILKPEVTYEDNTKLINLRAKFSTCYKTSGEGRKHNIELALKNINGKVLNAGEEFSFNKTAGRRSEANGYKQAIIIKQGEYVEGLGGGVCQASTTVYNCALLADMEIISAKNHSLEPSYIWPSFDAMVSGFTDLKFKNSGKWPVFIKAYGDGENAVVEIYGSSLPYKIVRRSEETLREQPPEDKIVVDTEHKYFNKDDFTPPGTQKRVWYSKGELRSTGYLIYYGHNGNFIEKKQIRNDIYKRTNGLIAVAP